MKKTLLGCLAASLICSTAVTANEQTPPAEQKPQAVAATPLPPVLNDTVQTQITQEFKKLLEGTNLKIDAPLVFEQNGDNYLVTIPEISLPVTDGQKIIPQQKVALIRKGDFAGFPQYQIQMNFLNRMESFFNLFFDKTSLDADVFEENIFWVPRLQLVTNETLNAKNLTFTIDDIFSATAEKVVVNQLAKALPEGRMDIGSLADVYKLIINTPFSQITVPQVSFQNSRENTEITGDNMLQQLTARRNVSKLDIPEISFSTPLAPGQNLSLRLGQSVVLESSQLKWMLTADNIKTSQPLSELTPSYVALGLIVDNLNQQDLLQLWSLQKQASLKLETEEPVDDKLTAEMNEKLDALLKNISIRIPNITVSNDKAGISAAGVITNLLDNLAFDITLSVTNFDFISPEQPPVDEAKCKEMAGQLADNPTDVALIDEIQTHCAPDRGLLEDLRPYLKTAARIKNKKGQTVDTFLISFHDNKLSVNGQKVAEEVYAPLLPQEASPDMTTVVEPATETTSAPEAAKVPVETAPEAITTEETPAEAPEAAPTEAVSEPETTTDPAEAAEAPEIEAAPTEQPAAEEAPAATVAQPVEQPADAAVTAEGKGA